MYFSTPGFGHSLLPTSHLSFGIGTLATGEVSRIKMAFDFCQTKNICQRPPLETITCRGGRSGFLVRWVRGWWLWKYYAGFKKKKSFKVMEKYSISSGHIWSFGHFWDPFITPCFELLHFIDMIFFTLCFGIAMQIFSRSPSSRRLNFRLRKGEEHDKRSSRSPAKVSKLSPELSEKVKNMIIQISSNRLMIKTITVMSTVISVHIICTL